MKVTEEHWDPIGPQETIYQSLTRILGRELNFIEELAALGAHPVGHSQVDPGRITRRLGADEGVREQT